jgi:hypothetical protein
MCSVRQKESKVTIIDEKLRRDVWVTAHILYIQIIVGNRTDFTAPNPLPRAELFLGISWYTRLQGAALIDKDGCRAVMQKATWYSGDNYEEVSRHSDWPDRV